MKKNRILLCGIVTLLVILFSACGEITPEPGVTGGTDKESSSSQETLVNEYYSLDESTSEDGLYDLSSDEEKSSGEITEYDTEENNDKDTEVERINKAVITEGNIKDNKELYNADDELSVITMYLTVSKGNDADGSNHTWDEINTYSVYDYKKMGVDRYKVEGLLQIDETGEGIGKESFGYQETVPNVSIQVRGQTSSKSKQKNYKIRIKDGKGKFREQRTLDLNKHVGTPFRFENKLCYDLLKEIPQLIGGRTQFVHLYVKDETTENSDGFSDYGLYTMVEQVNRTFLKNHNLDENGQMYKVSFFEWNKMDEIMMAKDDPEFDQASFDMYLEEKGDGDVSKLQETIEDIQNYSKPIEKIVEEHFDAENLCYWMAFNILIGNMDTGARNLFIYSPLNSQKFYFICWDMDASFHYGFNRFKGRHDGESWEQGMTKFLGLVLVRRMMKVQKYRDMLTSAVEDIYDNYVTPEKVQKMVDGYKEVVKPYLFSMPDFDNSKFQDEESYDLFAQALGSEVEDNYRLFLESMKNPWPFFVDVPNIDREKGETILNWEISYDYNDEDVKYDFILAKDAGFNDVLDEGHELTVPFASTMVLEPGTYFLRVKATNESGYTMECFDYYSEGGYGKHYGCYCFIVNEDGTVKPFEKELK
ncbi:CotH kinase family protein [Oribacterium sp. WCC10]|uniref:CotH kinase family protein n=1 Tax=Oribacterium sp. WCC10 TaxID=1855343 RepID=UPI0008F230A0|nr:CotH kinase family protein [Oribacterium sp. WCC10]SFG26181.1 spore coat protein H [Oribacterium sp. WCC10]